jgi:hypothetical protein
MRSLTLFNVFLGVFLAAFLGAGAASAQDADGVRFRGGVGLEAGAFIPAPVVLGGIGVAGELGAQINNTWGAYVVPSIDVLFGSAAGLGFSFGALADYTFDGLPVSVAAGPEAGVFAAFGASSSGAAAAAGAYYGVRLRGEYYLTLSSAPRRRKSLYVALDLHLDGDAFGGSASCSVSSKGCSSSTGAGSFLFSPMASIGYVAF